MLDCLQGAPSAEQRGQGCCGRWLLPLKIRSRTLAHPSTPQVYNEQLRDLLADTAPGRREAGRIQGAQGCGGWQITAGWV